MNAHDERARPTLTMMACLRRLHKTGGRLIRRTQMPSGWQVVSQDPTFYWFPTRCGNGLIARGMIDDDGCITELGERELEA